MILSVGSKVFFIGEYLALQGGPSLLASLEPRFQLKVYSAHDESGSVYGIHELSPAGLFYKKYSAFFKKYNLQFADPHGGQGGWGASSAQFALLAAFYYGHQNIIQNAEWDLDLQKVDLDYLQITRQQTTTGLPPSGLDVVAQLRGGLTLVNRQLGRIENKIWPFTDFTFLFFHTGMKVPTHTHLSQLQEIPEAALTEVMSQFMTSVYEQNSQNFIQSIKDYRKVLHDANLEASSTSDWIRQIQELPGVLAMKGCGALGADVILILVERNYEMTIIKSLRSWGIGCICQREELTGPIQVNFEWTSKDTINAVHNPVENKVSEFTESHLKTGIDFDV